MTIAHTAGVFALGIRDPRALAFIVPEQLYPWLTLVSGLLVVLVGASVLRSGSVREARHHDHVTTTTTHDHHTTTTATTTTTR